LPPIDIIDVISFHPLFPECYEVWNQTVGKSGAGPPYSKELSGSGGKQDAKLFDQGLTQEYDAPLKHLQLVGPNEPAFSGKPTSGLFLLVDYLKTAAP
jgi:hypothetical protein